MLAEPIPDPLARYLSICCNPNSAELLDKLRDVMLQQVTRETEARFKQQLAHAIIHQTITPELYKKITSDNEYTTQEDVQVRLREVWQSVYGNAPIVE